MRNCFAALLLQTATALEVIGSGFDGGGTLAAALHELGHKTYDFSTVLDGHSDGVADTWAAAARHGCNDTAALRAVLVNHTAVAGFPAALCWEELAAAFPRAKVVHTRAPASTSVGGDAAWWAEGDGAALTLPTIFPFGLLGGATPFYGSLNAMVEAALDRLEARAAAPANHGGRGAGRCSGGSGVLGRLKAWAGRRSAKREETDTDNGAGGHPPPANQISERPG